MTDNEKILQDIEARGLKLFGVIGFDDEGMRVITYKNGVSEFISPKAEIGLKIFECAPKGGMYEVISCLHRKGTGQ